MNNHRRGHRYRQAVAELKSRGEYQECWSCRKTVHVKPEGHTRCRLCITLGHYTALEDGGDPYNPANYGPQCGPCNYGDGARRTNRKRNQKTTPIAYRNYRNPRWLT